MKKLKLMMMTKMKNLILMGNSMMITMNEWCSYRKMYFRLCNTRPVFQLAGFYYIANPQWMFSAMKKC